MQSPAGRIVSAGSSFELVGAWHAQRPQILGAGAVSFSPVRAPACRSMWEVVPAVGLSLAGHWICVDAELSPLWKRWWGQECSHFHLWAAQSRFTESWSVQPGGSDTAQSVIPSPVEWSQLRVAFLLWTTWNLLQGPPGCREAWKKWAVWTGKEANTAFGDGSVCCGECF